MARGKRKGLPIHGWLVIDKSLEMTSTHVVAVVKRLTKAQKAGHGGTLDPLATGVLPIALGDATKTVPYVMDATKRYRFTVRFGIATATDDAEGEVVASSDERPDDAAIRAALAPLTGDIMQRPPSYAAVKVDGERAYDLARRGEAVDLPPRPVSIHTFDLVERPDADHAVFEVTSGKGAYVRSLARDLGEALGCYGHVSALRRMAVGSFTVENAISLDTLRQIVEDETLPQALVPLATALADIPALAVTEPQALRLRSGQSIMASPKLVSGDVMEGDTITALHQGRVIALGRFADGEFSPTRVFSL